MKTVKMLRDFSYRAGPRVFVQYREGVVYERTPEAAVRSILDAKAGEIVSQVKCDE